MPLAVNVGFLHIHFCIFLSNHLPLNLGIAIPFNLGHLLEVDIACDNDCCEENEPVLGISDIYIRELPR